MLEDREESRREELDRYPVDVGDNDTDVKTPTFIKTITGFIEVVAPKLQKRGLPHNSTIRRCVFKVDVSVNPRGLAVNCTRHSRGNTADITMFHNNEAFHQSARRKADGDCRLADNGPLATDYPEEWAVLADKGYQGLGDHVRGIHPKKGNQLTPEDRRQNELISSDRVIVENFLGGCAVYGAFVRRNSAGVNRFMTTSSKYA
ncbi:Harbinger transposase-derived nuclease domain [Phytophthora cactorum]|nr:Harbinger transposase-derived nuclease domain [Phytophthora cactorum]